MGHIAAIYGLLAVTAVSVPSQDEKPAQSWAGSSITAPHSYSGDVEKPIMASTGSWTFEPPEIKVILPPPPPPVVQTVRRVQPANIPSSHPDVVAAARSVIGVSYVSGGFSPSGFDCSGLTQWAYSQVGISIPRTTSGQLNAGTRIPRSEAKPGDIIWSPGHVGIYLGGNRQIDSPKPGMTVQERDIWQSNPVFLRMG